MGKHFDGSRGLYYNIMIFMLARHHVTWENEDIWRLAQHGKLLPLRHDLALHSLFAQSHGLCAPLTFPVSSPPFLNFKNHTSPVCDELRCKCPLMFANGSPRSSCNTTANDRPSTKRRVWSPHSVMLRPEYKRFPAPRIPHQDKAFRCSLSKYRNYRVFLRVRLQYSRTE